MRPSAPEPPAAPHSRRSGAEAFRNSRGRGRVPIARGACCSPDCNGPRATGDDRGALVSSRFPSPDAGRAPPLRLSALRDACHPFTSL